MTGMGTPNSQSRMPRPMIASLVDLVGKVSDGRDALFPAGAATACPQGDVKSWRATPLRLGEQMALRALFSADATPDL